MEFGEDVGRTEPFDCSVVIFRYGEDGEEELFEWCLDFEAGVALADKGFVFVVEPVAFTVED